MAVAMHVGAIPSRGKMPVGAVPPDATPVASTGYLGGLPAKAASFNAANLEYLSKSSATVDTGGQSYAVAFWVYINSLATQEFFVAKYGGLANGEFYIGKDTSNRIIWRLVGNSNFYDIVTTGTTFTTGWHFVVCSYDNATKVMSASLDGGSFVNRAAFSDSPKSNNAVPLILGAQMTSTGHFTGRLQCAGIWVGRTLSSGDVSDLFNSNAGRLYAQLPSGLLTSLVSYWNLGETSDGSSAVQRGDSHGSNHLADTNSVLSAAGTVGTTPTLALGGATLSGSATSGSGSASSGTAAVTLGAVTLSGSGSSVAPTASAGALTVTLAAATLSGAGVAASPGASAGDLAATLGSVTLSGAGTSGAAGASSGGLSATLGSATLAGAGTAAAPSASDGSLAASLGAVAASAAGASAPPTASSGDLAATLGAITPTGSGTAGTVGAATATLAATLGGLSFTGVGSSVAPTAAIGSLSTTLDAATLAGSGLVVVPTSAGSLAITLGAISLSGAGEAVNPAGSASGTLSASLGGVVLAGSGLAEGVAVLTRDDRVLLAMRDRLRDTNRFMRTDAVTGPKDIVHGSDIRNYAMLWFEQSEDIDTSMSGDEADFDHTAQFTLAIGVHEDDPTVRLRKLGELKAVAQNALNGQAVVDGMIPHLTLLRRTRRDRDAKPIDSVWLITGEYAWFDSGYDGRDDTDDLAPPGYDPDAEPPPSEGPVSGVGGLAFTVAAGTYRLTDDSSVASPGDFGAAADDATTLVWLDPAGDLGTGGSFPGTPHAPLASVTAAGGEITAVVDQTI